MTFIVNQTDPYYGSKHYNSNLLVKKLKCSFMKAYVWAFLLESPFFGIVIVLLLSMPTVMNQRFQEYTQVTMDFNPYLWDR